MTADPGQEQQFVKLCSEHDAVARLLLSTGELSLICRDSAGTVEATAVIERGATEPLESMRAVEALIAARALAQRIVSDTTEHLRVHLLELRDAGEQLNVAQLARDTGIARSTFYQWMGGKETAAA